MPKKTLVYRDFSGGEVTSANPRVIKQNELQLLSGMLVDEQGYLTTLYPPQKATATATLKDFTYTVSPGRGIFYFKSDYAYVSGGDTTSDGPYHYLMITNALTGDISITDGSTKTEIGDINIYKPDFYIHNNIVRIGIIAGSGTAGGQKWFGPIGASTNKKLLGHTYLQRWHMTDNFLEPPFWGVVGRCMANAKTMGSTTNVVAPAQTDLVFGTRIADDSGVEFTSSDSHGLSVGDTVVISDSEYYSGSHTVTAVDSATTFKIGKTFFSIAEDEEPRVMRKGDQSWFAGMDGIVGAGGIASRGNGGIDNGEDKNYNHILWSYIDGTSDEIMEIDELESTENQLSLKNAITNNTTAWAIFPPPGEALTGEILGGMNLDIYQSRGSDKGAWPPGDYEFGQTLIYESNQESLITKLVGDDITIDANEVLYVRALISGIAVSSAAPMTGLNQDIDPRWIGGRIYTRKAGTGDSWILLIDADFRTTSDTSNRDLRGGGTRLNLTDKYDYWYVRVATVGHADIWGNSASTIGSNPTYWRGFYSTQYTVKSPSPFTYEAINGFSQDEVALGFGIYQTELKYRTSVICNSRVFVANVDYYDSRNQSASKTKMGDAILYSPPSKMDTFPPSNRLDVAEGDGDEFTCLMESGGMLLAFKESTLYIVDVKNPNPAGWRLQNKFDGLGIKDTHSATKIESAIVFANNYGCWIYDNGQLKDLIQGKISVNQWQAWARPNFRKALFAGVTNGSGAATNKLKDDDAVFAKSNVSIGDKVFNTTDSTTALVTAIDSDIVLTIDSDIMSNSETYYIESKSHGPNIGYDNISKKLIIVNDCENVSDSPRFYDLITGAWTRGWDTALDRTGAALKTGVKYFMNGTEGANYDTVNNIWTNFVTIPEGTSLDVRGHNKDGAGAVVYVDERRAGFTDSTVDTNHTAGTGSTFGDNPRILRMDDTTLLAVNMIAYGTGLDGGSSTITQIDSSTLFRIDEDTTATNANQAFRFIGERDLRWFALKQKVVDYDTSDAAGDAGANRARYNIVTKDEDFGAPNNLKKIYSVTIDYITETGGKVFDFDVRYQINGNYVSSDIGREWLLMDSPLIIDDTQGTGSAIGDEVNTLKIPFSSFSATSGAPIKCHSIALQIHNDDGDSGRRQFVKILSIGMEYRIISKLIGTEITAAGDATL